LHIHKDLASNHKVVSEISVFIELNVDEFCKPMRQVPNAFSWVHGCLKAKSIQDECSRENENNIFFVVWIWLRDDLSNKWIKLRSTLLEARQIWFSPLRRVSLPSCFKCSAFIWIVILRLKELFQYCPLYQLSKMVIFFLFVSIFMR
jgi:hypothetical protein